MKTSPTTYGFLEILYIPFSTRIGAMVPIHQ